MICKEIQRILAVTHAPVIVELGACDAKYTASFVMCCQRGAPQIYSFEPDPRNVKICLERMPPEVHFIPAAASNITGKTMLNLAAPQPNGEIGSSSLSAFKDLTKAFPWCTQVGTAEVDCWRLDDFCFQEKISYIDLLWADVQGAELMVIEGAQRILRSTRYFWTEFEGLHAQAKGTLYQNSASLEEIRQALPDPTGWQLGVLWAGDALLVNTHCTGNPNPPVI